MVFMWSSQDWKMSNPFEDWFMRDEVKGFDAPKYNKNGVQIVMKKIRGRCDDYLNTNFRAESPLTPVLYIDGKLWMSLSYMEIQSAYLPILLADGVVGTCGLGLGYFALRAASKETVKKVIVFEREKRVINYFNECYKNREGFDKIEIVHGDARKKCRGYDFDFLFVDIYQTMLPNEVITDIFLFNENNNIGEEERWDMDKSDHLMAGYWFWGYERVVLDALIGYKMIERNRVMWLMMDYFRKWSKTPLGFEEKEEDYPVRTLADLYRAEAEPEYCEDVLSAMGYDILY